MLRRSALLPILIYCGTSIAGGVHAAPSTTIAWEREGTGAFDSTAASVGTAGDVNCDGYADLIIGIPRDDQSTSPSGGSSDSGTVEVWFGSANRPQPNPNGQPDWYTYTGGFGANFGAAVAAGDVNGDGCDDVIASEPFPSFATISPQRVHVFLGPLSTVTQPPDAGAPPPDLPEWTATLFQRTVPEVGGQRPVSVAAGDVSGDGFADIIVGQPEASNGQQEEGVVLVWLGTQFFASKPPGTVANADWMAQSDQAGAHLGESVASAFDFNGDGRDDVLAGAPDFNSVGWAFMWLGSPVFASTADGTTANKAWSLTTGSPSSRLGASVAAAGDFDGDGFGDVVIGAPNLTSFGVFTESGDAFLARGGNPMPGSDNFAFSFGPVTPLTHLGTSVATAGDVNGDGLGDILVGEPDIGLSGTQAGRVHLILGQRGYSQFFANAPAAAAIYTAPNTINNIAIKSRFGSAVGTAGDWNGDGFSDVIVGAPQFGQSEWGKAYVFLGKGETLNSFVDFRQSIGQASAVLGLGVAFAGDINHDGFTDIVGGAPNYEDGPAHDGEGRIFVSYGGPCGPNCAPFSEFIFPGDREGNQPGAQLGWSVSSAGDVNGDGYADVIAGAPSYDGEIICGVRPIFFCPVPDSGLAQVFLGGPGGLSFSANWSVNGNNQQSSQYGYSVTGAGDVNGDGFGDVLVAAPYYDGAAGGDEGRVFLYLGSASGLSSSPSWFESGGQANARLGIDVAGAGDVNGDGYSDVIIGADGHGATGAAFVYLGRPTTPQFPQGLWDTPIKTLVGVQAGSSFGITVATAGDINRDGKADVVVGAPTYLDDPFVGPQTGMVSVYHGAAAGPSTTATTNLYGAFPDNGGNRFGNGVAGAGDVNGDGYGDLIVGDQWFTGPAGFAQGQAYIYHGTANGLTPFPARTFQDCPHDYCDFGRDVAGAGDVNGDGFSDVLIAAYGLTDAFLNQGAIFVHMGNEGQGTPMQPLQSLGFDGPPRAILGSTPDRYGVSMNLKSAAGRSRTVMEVEAKPFGQDFNVLNVFNTLALDNVLNPRTSITTTINNPNDLFHWRARVRSSSPLFGRSRWISLPENAPRELDVRVLPEPGLAVALGVGMGVLAAVGRRRASRGDRTQAID